MIPTAAPVYDYSYTSELNKSETSFMYEKGNQIVLFADTDSDFSGLYKLEGKNLNRSVFISIHDSKINNSNENDQASELQVFQVVNNYEKLLNIFSKFDFMDESSSALRTNMINIEKQLSFNEICEYLKSIVQNPSESVRVRCGIADYLCNYDYTEVQPSANSILEKLLLSENDIEIEYGLELADNFDDPAILPILDKCIPKSKKTKWTLKSIKEQLKGA